MIFIVAAIVAGCSSESPPPAQPLTPVYDTDHIEIEQIDLQSIFSERKLTMVNVWATFCPACNYELPVIGQLASEHGSEDFQIVGIVLDSVDEAGQPLEHEIGVAKRMIAQARVEHRHFLPTVEILDGFLKDVTAIPSTLFFDRNGEQVGDIIIGARTPEKWMLEINQRLGEIDE